MIEPASLELIEYRDYIITRAPLHVPYAYQWQHRDWDGAPESAGEGPADDRYGYGVSESDCREQIDELLEAER